MSGQYVAGMHRTRTLAAVGAVLALAATLAACGGEEQPETTPAAAVPTTLTPTVAPTPTPASSTTPAALKIGDSTTFLDGAVTTTVLNYRQPAGSRGIPDPDRAGDTWGAIEVKVCTTSEVIAVSSALWVLTYADGAVLEPSGVSYAQLPQPRYPWAGHEVRPGRCVRGWITYEVPAKLRPAYVQYQPDGQAATEWQVK